MKVDWSENAVEHLDGIYTFIGLSSESYALRMVDRVTRRSTQIGSFPESGRVVPEIGEPRIREVIEGPYRIIYHILPDRIEVLAVLHGAQNFTWDS